MQFAERDLDGSGTFADVRVLTGTGLAHLTVTRWTSNADALGAMRPGQFGSLGSVGRDRPRHVRVVSNKGYVRCPVSNILTAVHC